MYSLFALNDDGSIKKDRGACGNASEVFIARDEDAPCHLHKVGSVPVVDACVRVSSSFSRFDGRDQVWLTCRIAEILSDVERDGVREIVFKTAKETYRWREE